MLDYNVKEDSTLHLVVLSLNSPHDEHHDVHLQDCPYPEAPHHKTHEHHVLAFAGVCREWDGNMASVIVNAALGILFADMRLVL